MKRSPAGSLGILLREVLGRSTRPLSAYELVAQVSRETHRRTYAAAIYRAMMPLVEQRIALNVVSARGWVANLYPDEPATLLLLCDDCGQASQLRIEPLAPMLPGLGEHEGFSAARFHVEMHGHCGVCARGRDVLK